MQGTIKKLDLAYVRFTLEQWDNELEQREFLRQLQIRKAHLEHQLYLHENWPRLPKTRLDRVLVWIFNWAIKDRL